MKATPAARRSRREWRRTIAAWKRSGLSQKEFCEKRGIRARTFGWWRWKLERGRNDKAPSGKGPEIQATPAFVELTVKPEPAPVSRKPEELEVRVGETLAIRVPAGFDRSNLVELVSALLEASKC